MSRIGRHLQHGGPHVGALVGPQEEETDTLWVCADATGLHKVPYHWAGVFVPES